MNAGQKACDDLLSHDLDAPEAGDVRGIEKIDASSSHQRYPNLTGLRLSPVEDSPVRWRPRLITGGPCRIMSWSLLPEAETWHATCTSTHREDL